MCWKGDEKLYQPRIHSQRIRELHKVSEQVGLPMTVVLDLLIRKYVGEIQALPYSPLPDGLPDFVPRGEIKTGE